MDLNGSSDLFPFNASVAERLEIWSPDSDPAEQVSLSTKCYLEMCNFPESSQVATVLCISDEHRMRNNPKQKKQQRMVTYTSPIPCFPPDMIQENTPNDGANREDYIRVPSKQEQVKNSHSLAERMRRERINERMRLLQDLIPGCNKITSKATVLDEIIKYVQSLQHQVEFLSMKLAAANPELADDVKQIFSKDIPHLQHGTPDFQDLDAEVIISHSNMLSSSPKQLVQARMVIPRSPAIGPMKQISKLSDHSELQKDVQISDGFYF